jgi:hypothetical protein
VSLLAQLLAPPRDAAPDPRLVAPNNSALTREDAVVLAITRSLLTIGGRNYRGLIAERAERSPEPLRGQLKKLLGA